MNSNNLSQTLITVEGVVSDDRGINNLMHLPTIGFHVSPNMAISKHEYDKRMKAKEDAEKLADEIADREAGCLRTIHARYCIIKGIPMGVAADVSCYVPDEFFSPNYREYWYKWGTPDQYFLMSRDLTLAANGIDFNLDIIFNAEISREGE